MKKICTFVLNKPKVKEMAQLIVTVEDASLLSDLKRAIKNVTWCDKYIRAEVGLFE